MCCVGFFRLHLIENVVMLYVLVEFEPNGKQYVYQTPVRVTVSDIVLVNVYGAVKAAKVKVVSERVEGNYRGPIKTIAGLGYMLEDLEQPATDEPVRRNGFVEWLTSL
jgi:hypothetical protein